MNDKKKIGFDLDRVFVDYPPIVPGWLIDWLYKNHNHKLSYRIPTSSFEIWVRKLSHLPFLRPPMPDNIQFVQELAKSEKYELYLISSRYGFLQDITYILLNRFGLIAPFKQIFLNTQNEQAHLFKERVIKQLGINEFVDDDAELLDYLKPNCPEVKLIHYLPDTRLEEYFRER